MRRDARRLVYSGVVLACGLGAGGAAVPQDFRGVWAQDGHCDAGGVRLVLTGTTAQLGNGAAAPIVLVPHDSPSGEDALHWAGEGEADNFVLRRHPDAIVYHPQGYGMDGAALFLRCR